jgi:hypothetical protein
VARLATASLLALCLAPAAHGAVAEGAPPVDDDARAALRQQVADDASDWIARYNLGLAEAEAGDAGRAFGHTLAAFAYAPGDAVVRTNAASFAATLPGVEPATAALLAGGLAALAAPATWQITLVGSLAVLALGAALVLRRFYLGGIVRSPRAWEATSGRPYMWLALGAAGLGMLGSATSGIALRRWGPMTDPRAVAVVAESALRAVPTDAAPDDRAGVVAAGTLATGEQTFLGWTKISLGNGDSGWVRNGDLVALYAGRQA